jgi:hypothetical protein
MRQQSYSDKQREAQQRKKQEDLWAKAHPEASPAPESPKPDVDTDEPAKKTDHIDKPARRSA